MAAILPMLGVALVSPACRFGYVMVEQEQSVAAGSHGNLPGSYGGAPVGSGGASSIAGVASATGSGGLTPTTLPPAGASHSTAASGGTFVVAPGGTAGTVTIGGSGDRASSSAVGGAATTFGNSTSNVGLTGGIAEGGASVSSSNTTIIGTGAGADNQGPWNEGGSVSSSGAAGAKSMDAGGAGGIPIPYGSAGSFVFARGGSGSSGVGNSGNGGVPSATTSAPLATCSDGSRNQDELAIDCGGSRCAPCLCSFSVPEVLGNPNYTSNKVWSPTLTADELSIYFGVEVSSTPEQIGVCTRSGISSEFGLGQIVQAGEAGQASYGTPFILPDGLTLYYYSIRTNGSSDRDLYVSRRNSVSAAFGSSQALTELNTTGPEHLPWVSNDELTIYFTRVASGQSDANIWRATRALASGPFDPPELVSELNSPATEDRVALTVDQRTIIFASQRVGGRMQLYQAVRATTSDPFGSPVAIPELASSASDSNPALTPDGNTLYFSSTRNGTNNQILRSTRTCP